MTKKKVQHWKTLTAVFRNDNIIIKNLTQYKYLRDNHLFYHLLKIGNGFYFTEIMGVYRIHEGGVYSLKQGIINKTAAYNIFKEIYQTNKDEYSRYKFIRAAVALLSYNLSHLYPGNRIHKNVQLYLEIIFLIRSIIDLKFLITVFISPKFKAKTKKLRNDIYKSKVTKFTSKNQALQI